MALCGYGGVEAARETLKPEREAAVSEVQKAVIAQLTGGGAEPRLGDETIIEGLLEKEGGATEEEAAAAAAAAAPGASRFDIADVRSELKRSACIALREVVAETGTRQDGRSTTDVRDIDIRMGCLPKMVHGSALFTRGETQSLATATLGDASMSERYEGIEG